MAEKTIVFQYVDFINAHPSEVQAATRQQFAEAGVPPGAFEHGTVHVVRSRTEDHMTA